MKIGLFLMGKKGLASLQALSGSADAAQSKIAFVVAARDKNVINDYYSEIQQLTQILKIPFYDRTQPAFETINIDFGIAIAWRWMIPLTNFKLVVFHDSLLPELRGFNPLVTALIRGDNEIGVTALFAEEEFDKGPIIAQLRRSVQYPIKISVAIDLVSECYAELLPIVIGKITSQSITFQPQDELRATYSLWRNDDDYRIDWSTGAVEICRMIDAVGYPYMGACTHYDGKKIRIIEAKEIDDLNIVNRVSGKILRIDNNEPIVVCGHGMIKIITATYDQSEHPVTFEKVKIRLT